MFFHNKLLFNIKESDLFHFLSDQVDPALSNGEEHLDVAPVLPALQVSKASGLNGLFFRAWLKFKFQHGTDCTEVSSFSTRTREDLSAPFGCACMLLAVLEATCNQAALLAELE